jgi:catechol 2,3-dioxygenase-like lactoylglutathione lyase family enzyme
MKYVHTNIISNNWRKLAQFYIDVFECIPVPPERKLSGKWLEKGTGLKGADLEGVHLRLPGYGDNGPTLEIFQYKENKPGIGSAVNRPGFTHIAFSVEDVKETLQKIISNSGKALGEIVSKEIPGAGTISFVYATDPEGNIVEIQHWK